MHSRPRSKQSNGRFKQLIERAAIEESAWAHPHHYWFGVNELDARGQPVHAIRAWAVLHFLSAGSPFCCLQTGCHMCTDPIRIGARIARMMGLQGIELELHVASRARDGVCTRM
jgi:hypothetical protein